MAETILVTGGAGYIGSHASVELIRTGYRVVIIDNLCNSFEESINRIERITGTRPGFHRIDIRDAAALEKLFSAEKFAGVIHFAGLKAVGESVVKPLLYYDNNISGTVCLLQAMQHHSVRTLVFSSSATVYGDQKVVPVAETASTGATNAYGRSKLMIEEILHDLNASEPGWRIARLRYFNPVGAHDTGLMGEDPHGVPNNLMPYVCQVAVGKLPELRVFGSDYPTPDGTGVRDYIHVVDLALGHVAALRTLAKGPRMLTVNLGTGHGYSVLDVIRAFEKASGKKVAHKIVERRPGDVAMSYANASLAKELLGWTAERTIDDMCRDAWNWQVKNPSGYRAA